MSHQIMNDEAMFSVRKTPWHNLGTVLDEPPTTDEALVAAKLNWHVYKKPSLLEFEGTLYPTSTVHTYRIDEDRKPVILGSVSDRYEIIQNHEAFRVFDEVLLDHGYTYETAGALRNGEICWILAKGPTTTLAGDDEIEQYTLLTNSHGGSLGLSLIPTTVRVVCANTHAVAMGRTNVNSGFYLKHTRNVKDRYEKVINLLQNAEGSFDTAVNSYNRFNDVKMDNDEAIKYFESVIPSLAIRDEVLYTKTNRLSPAPTLATKKFELLMANFRHGSGNRGETLWDAFNAITEFVDHDWYDANLWTIGFGEGRKIKNAAFSNAIDVADEQPLFLPPTNYSA